MVRKKVNRGEGREDHIGVETRERRELHRTEPKRMHEENKAVSILTQAVTGTTHTHTNTHTHTHTHSQGGTEIVRLPAQIEKCPNSKHLNEGHTPHPQFSPAGQKNKSCIIPFTFATSTYSNQHTRRVSALTAMYALEPMKVFAIEDSSCVRERELGCEWSSYSRVGCQWRVPVCSHQNRTTSRPHWC